MKRSGFIALFCCLLYSAGAQVSIVVAPKATSLTSRAPDTTKNGHPLDPFAGNWARSIMFSTDNPQGTGHLDWAFHDTTVFRDVVVGGPILGENAHGHSIKEDSFATERPFLMMDSDGLVAYVWQTDHGLCTILYSDSVQEFTTLVIDASKEVHPKKKQVLNIYDVVHFW